MRTRRQQDRRRRITHRRSRRQIKKQKGGEYVQYVYNFSVKLHGFEEDEEGGAWNFNIEDDFNISNNANIILENLRFNIHYQKMEGLFNEFKQIEFEYIQGNKFRVSAEYDTAVHHWDDEERKNKYAELVDSYETSEFLIREDEDDQEGHNEFLQVKGTLLDAVV